MLALVLSAVALPCLAEQLRQVGVDPKTSDKIYIDLDSIKMVDGDRIATTVTVYPEPRVNIHGFVMDRHIQVSAFDCAGARFVPMRMIGYLSGKPSAFGPETTDWRDKLVPLPPGDINHGIFDAVCGAPVANPAGPGAARPTPSPMPPVQNQLKISSGSGILVDDEGYVLTNAHVVNGCRVMAVKPLGAPAVTASLEAIDPKNDLALIKVRPGLGIAATFRAQTKPARLGETIGVIGYPLTGVLSNEPKATFGQINSVAGLNNDYTLLQISAPVQPGNSGGPVLDEAGLVVGVVVSEISPAALAKAGILPQNVNFAIRGELAQIFMTAHGVPFATESPHHRLQSDEIAAAGQKSTAQIVCMKS